MLVRLTGLLESIDTGAGGAAVISTPDGLAREVLVPAYLSALLSGRAGSGAGIDGGGGPEGLVGRVVRLHVVEYLESVNQGTSFTPRLLGFGSPRERSFFELLTSVKGLGNRRGLRALAAEPGMIARAIVERDTRVLQKLPEIGPKLAETIVHELKSKAEPFIGLRPGVEVVDAAEATGASVRTHGGSSAFERIEMKAGGAGAGVVIGAEEPDTASGKPRKRAGAAKADAGNGDTGGQESRGGRGGRNGGATTVSPPTPPIHETVRVLISLGEQPIEAERMVARAIDRASGEGRLVEVTSAAALLAAAYAAR